MKLRFAKITALVLLAALALPFICGCQHIHEYNKDWSVDYHYHWKAPLCDDTDEVAEKDVHNYENDVCVTCGYERPARLTIDAIDGDFHSALQKQYLAGDYEDVFRYADGHAEKSLPDGIIIAWRYSPLSLDIEKLKEFSLTVTNEYDRKTVVVTEQPDFDEQNVQAFVLQNVYLNTKYNVMLQATDNNNQNIATAYAEFTTTSTGPRNLLVHGVTNVRDLGGYVTDQGTIRQGMLFRTARLNRSSSNEIVAEIQSSGIRVMLDKLKVKTEVDLRGTYESSNLTASVLGDTVKYYCMNMGMQALTAPEQKDKIKNVFDILCNKDNYPVFFHCHIGTDRTGIIAFLCEALLGADETTLYTDYLFSNFGHIGGGRFSYTIFTYIETMNAYEGDNLAQKVEQYLYDCGITAEQIKAFKDIMLEK